MTVASTVISLIVAIPANYITTKKEISLYDKIKTNIRQ